MTKSFARGDVVFYADDYQSSYVAGVYVQAFTAPDGNAIHEVECKGGSAFFIADDLITVGEPYATFGKRVLDLREPKDGKVKLVATCDGAECAAQVAALLNAAARGEPAGSMRHGSALPEIVEGHQSASSQFSGIQLPRF